MVEMIHNVKVRYGMGAEVRARLQAAKVAGRSCRELIGELARHPQPTEPGRRAARVLEEVMASDRQLDVELCRGSNGQRGPGQPVELDQVVVRQGEQQGSDQVESFSLQVSESYVGG